MRLPVSGMVARVALWGGFRFDAGWYTKLERFWQTEDLEHHFQIEGQAIRYAVHVAVDRKIPKVRLIPGSRRSQTAQGYESCGDKRMKRNTMERA